MNCKRCGHEDFEPVRQQKSDGSWCVFRQCRKCGGMWDGKYIAKDRVPDWTKLRQVASANAPATCARCGKTFAQAHHYFQQALARRAGQNADAWPVENLCDDCHILWHKHVTPGLLHHNWKAAKHGR